MTDVHDKAARAKIASRRLAAISAEEKNSALLRIADGLIAAAPEILEANSRDMERAQSAGVPTAIQDRLRLTNDRIEAIAQSIEVVISLSDPIGEQLAAWSLDNGLAIEKCRVPLGVIGIIYEARPNVTVDAAVLCLKAGNATVLRGSSSAIDSNRALAQAMRTALAKSSIPEDAVVLIEDTSREAAAELFTMNRYLDVLIPRGGASLIQHVLANASVPVLETGAGVCHVFIDEAADYERARTIVLNAKTQRPSVCNAAETLLIHKKWDAAWTTQLLEELQEAGVDCRGCECICEIAPHLPLATEQDWGTEYLDMILSVKLVSSVDEAIDHIATYGTRHSEAIVTENKDTAEHFLTNVDAAAVYHNASTRFTDGFMFGFGAEIGISTQKLHARGPMGLPELTASKYILRGSGQVRE